MLKTVPNRVIVVPDKYLSDFLTDFYLYLIQIFDECIPGLVRVPSSQFVGSPDLETVVLISLPHWMIDDMNRLESIHPNSKIICWHDDMFWRNDACRWAYDEVFRRADLIVHGSRDVFADLYREHLPRARWMPLFAPPYFYQGYNPQPKRRCLLSGHCSPVHYPLRHALRGRLSEWLDVLDHPGYVAGDDRCVRENYSRLLHSYFCCVMDSGKAYGACRYQIDGSERKFSRPIDDQLAELMGDVSAFKLKGQVLLKHFEVPASGSLLLCDEHAPEIADLGFIPHVNYVPVREDDALHIIEDCCRHPERYEEIRRNGWLLAQEHTIERRAKQLASMLEPLYA